MTIKFSLFRSMLLAAGTLAGTATSFCCADAATSGWEANEGGRMRLMALAPDTEGHVRAALQIEPAPGWITYWREPGESGIPPQLTVAPGSALKLERISYPVPKPISIGPIREIGYDAPVTMPLDFRVVSEDGEPLMLNLSAFIGLCKDICIPFQASFSLPLPDDRQSKPDEQAILDAAAATLPEAPSADFDVETHALSPDMHSLSLQLRLPEAGAATPEIFVTGPSGHVFFGQQTGGRDGRRLDADIAIGKLPKNYDIHGEHWGVLVIDGKRAMETTLAFD